MRNPDGLLPRRPPAPAIHRTLAEVEEEWNRQAEAFARKERPGVLHLLGEKRHPLVRAELRRTARWRRILSAGCLLVPLAVFVGLLVAGEHEPFTWGRPVWTASEVTACAFVCLWPALMFGASALSSAMAVISDRARGTAAQIVLTPLSGRTIAAARILPWPGPFLLGILAASPLYVWAGGWAPFCAEGSVLTPLSFLPMRPLAALAIAAGARPPGLSAGGAMCGLFMLASDAGLVWAAAHWGAAYATWLGGLPGVMLFMLWRLFYVSVVFVGWMIPTFMCLAGPGSIREPIGVMLLAPVVIYLLALVWFFPVRGAVRSALVEFLRYDRLAGDDFNPGYFKRFRRKVRSEGPPRL